MAVASLCIILIKGYSSKSPLRSDNLLITVLEGMIEGL